MKIINIIKNLFKKKQKPRVYYCFICGHKLDRIIVDAYHCSNNKCDAIFVLRVDNELHYTNMTYLT